jgi:hypothetical protein
MGAILVTLDEYKVAEGIAGTSKDDQLDPLIASVSQLVKTYCGNSFVDYITTNRIDTFNIDWTTHRVSLEECPVISIVSVEERTSYGSPYNTLTTDNFEYYLDPRTDCIFKTNSSGRPVNWAKGIGSVRVTYNAGYDPLPEDLRLAVYDLINYYFHDEHNPRKTLSSATIENQGTGSGKGFPDHIKRVLDLYKQIQ